MSPLTIERVHDMDEACRLIREFGLFLDDENLSHTLFVLQQHEDRERLHTPLLAAWFVKDPNGEAKGCALVAEGLGFTDGSPTVSLFVSQDSRGQGLGSELLGRALALFPDVWGFHTPEAEKLYAKEGLEMTFFSADMTEDPDPQPSSGSMLRP